MKEILKVMFLFKKPTWDDYRWPYIFFGIVAWLELIVLVVSCLIAYI
jgi:hypothetical protein